MFGSALTWNKVSARDVSVGVVPEGASNPFAISQERPVSTSGISPELVLICVVVPIHLVVLPFSACVVARGFSLMLMDCSSIVAVGLVCLCTVMVFSCNVVCHNPDVATRG